MKKIMKNNYQTKSKKKKSNIETKIFKGYRQKKIAWTSHFIKMNFISISELKKKNDNEK